MLLPPGGHVERDELPHEAALREVREETGLEATLVTADGGIESPTARSLPRPRHLLLEDSNVHDGAVGHQHVDMVYYASADSRAIAPEAHETDAWAWYDAADLRAAELPAGVCAPALAAIESVDG